MVDGRSGSTTTPKSGSKGVLTTGRLAGLSMRQAIWVLSWPVLVESVLNWTVGMTDTVIGASMGEAETSAIGGASFIMWFIGLVIMALCVGATAMISRAMGRGRVAAANAVLGQSVTLSLTLGALVGLVVYLASGSIASMVGMDDATRDYFREYLAVIALGAPAFAVLCALIACARGAGDSVRPLYAMAVRAVVNIPLSWLLTGIDITLPAWLGGFVIENPSSIELGIIGIALGTVMADLVGACILLVMALSGTWGIRLKARRLRPHRVTVVRLARLGIPNFAETFGMWIGNFLIVAMVGQLGSVLLGAHIIAIRVESISFLPGFAIGMAAATLAGQYIGAQRSDLAWRAVGLCTVLSAAIMGLLGLWFILFAEGITAFVSDQPSHLEQTPELIRICGWVQIPFALAITFRAAMRGAGDVRVVMALTWISTYGIRLPLAYFLSGVDIPIPRSLGGGVIENPVEGWGLTGLWYGLCAEIVIRGAIFSARFFQRGWLKKRV